MVNGELNGIHHSPLNIHHSKWAFRGDFPVGHFVKYFSVSAENIGQTQFQIFSLSGADGSISDSNNVVGRQV
jgi:hypothetical protein